MTYLNQFHKEATKRMREGKWQSRSRNLDGRHINAYGRWISKRAQRIWWQSYLFIVIYLGHHNFSLFCFFKLDACFIVPLGGAGIQIKQKLGGGVI